MMVGNGHFPLIESGFLCSWRMDLSKEGRHWESDVKDDNTVNILNEQNIGVIIGSVDLNGGKIFNFKFIHQDRVNSSILMAGSPLPSKISTLPNVEEDNFLDVPQNNNQVMADKLN